MDYAVTDTREDRPKAAELTACGDSALSQKASINGAGILLILMALGAVAGGALFYWMGAGFWGCLLGYTLGGNAGIAGAVAINYARSDTAEDQDG